MKRYIFAIVVFILVLGFYAYNQSAKSSAKSFRIQCHKKTTTFEKIYHPKDIIPIQKAIKNGNFTISISEQKSKYMKTKLFSYINSKDIAKDFATLLNHKKDDAKYKIHILTYENDKLDPKKKSPKAKLYEGYLVFSFYFDDKLSYRLQLDFYEKDGRDIDELLMCAKKSLNSL